MGRAGRQVAANWEKRRFALSFPTNTQHTRTSAAAQTAPGSQNHPPWGGEGEREGGRRVWERERQKERVPDAICALRFETSLLSTETHTHPHSIE